MANHAQYLQFLIGCGIRTLSMNPVYLAENQKTIGKINSVKAGETALRLLATGNIDTIREELFPRNTSVKRRQHNAG